MSISRINDTLIVQMTNLTIDGNIVRRNYFRYFYDFIHSILKTVRSMILKNLILKIYVLSIY